MANKIDFNEVQNDIELLCNECEEFIKEAQKTREGKFMSQEFLKQMFFFWKTKELENKIIEQRALLHLISKEKDDLSKSVSEIKNHISEIKATLNK